MKSVPTTKIRNVALVGHGGAGKTTLAEAMLFSAGATSRMGRVEDGNTVTDYDPESQARKASVSLTLAAFEVDGHKINLIDSPGYVDFIADAVAALHAADMALFVVSAVDGVEVQTEALWKIAAEKNIPRAIYLSKMDKERADFERTMDDLHAKFGNGVAPLELPIGLETGFKGVVSLLDDQAFVYSGGQAAEVEVPTDMSDLEHTMHEALVEGIVVGDEELMERYLMEDKIEPSELAAVLGSGIASASVFPVLCGSAPNQIGIDRLIRFLVEEAPAPAAREGQAVAEVFKTVVDPFIGHINMFKVLQGTVKTDAVLVNGRTVGEEKLHQLFSLRGKEQLTLSEVAAGDIAAVAKLNNTGTGDVLGERGAKIDVAPFQLPSPTLPTAIHAKSKTEEDKLANALHRLVEEDPVIRIERNPETRQTILWGMGETHLNIALEKIQRKFGVGIEQEPVRVAYRETITATGEAEGKHKKQSGGHGQFGVASLRVEPKERGGGFEFVDAIVGGAIPRQFIPAVEKGVIETMDHGGALGFPVVDVRVTCFDGKYHAVDSNELSFKMAATQGFREACQKAKPVLLEPISELTVVVPEAYQGDVMGDLNSKRGRVQGSASIGGGECEIVAFVPTAEVLRYSIDLRSMSQGRGRFSAKHSHYDPVPPNVADKITAEAKAAKADAH